jgi:hypothetical protein
LHVSVGLTDKYNDGILDIKYSFCMVSMYIPTSSGHLCPNMGTAVPNTDASLFSTEVPRNRMNDAASTYPEDENVGYSEILV